MISFNFKTYRETEYGDSIYIVGNSELLGNWDPMNGLELKTHENIYPIWESPYVECDTLEDLLSIQYKYVLIDTKCNIHWDSGNNRRLLNCLTLDKCLMDDTLSYRYSKNAIFTSNHYKNHSVLSKHENIKYLYIKINGEIKNFTYCDIISYDFCNKMFTIKVKNNYIKKNKIQNVYMPYYRIKLENDSNIKIYGPYSSIKK